MVKPVPGRGRTPVHTGDFVRNIKGKSMPVVQETAHSNMLVVIAGTLQ